MANTVVKDKPIVEEKKQSLVAGLDINQIVKKAQEFYGKDKGLAKQIATGKSIVRPTKDDDFILWQGGDFWFELTKVKGIPFGRFIEIAGLADVGKSTLGSQFMVYAQKQGYFVILADTEQKFQSTRYDEQMGGNSSNLLIVDSNSIINVCKGVAYLVKTIKEQNKDAKILIVLDSLGAGLNSSEQEDTSEDMSRQPGATAKEITWCFKKWARLINEYQNRETGEHSISVLVINQVYAKIGFMQSGYKSKGGSSIEYMPSLRLMLSKKKELTRIKGGKKLKYGIVSRVKIVKNHLFDGSDSLAEADVVVSASGIELMENIKKKDADVEGWDEKDVDDGEE